MSKHTPGPWNWDEEVPTGYLGANWQEIAPWLVDGDGYPVLEALESALTILVDDVGDFDYDKARAAIAKARGKQP